MIYKLNNQLLTSDRIITGFQSNLSEELKGKKNPRWLDAFKKALKSMFFSTLEQASDQQILDLLAKDGRFTPYYHKLKQVLSTIFSLNDSDNREQVLEALKSLKETDWDTSNASNQFDKLNAQYGYFDNPPESLHNLFTELVVACHTIIVLFEENNTPNNRMAYDYAYKLMVLYVNPDNPSNSTLESLSKDAYNLINNIDSDKGHPFHEALLVSLNHLPHANELTDRAGWQALISMTGVKAFQAFLMANKIEQKIAEQPNEGTLRAPKNLKEANNMLALCTYTRSNEDSAFAALCHRCKVSESTFNRCLDYMAEKPGWPKKPGDNLPEMTIKGKDDALGLYWLKLPVTDKRALILGSPVLTGCCQSIGDHSEQCVKDAVSLDENGLYVLVRQRKPGNFALIKNDEINEQDFKIIGQSYVWKSLTGNLCLDSLECLDGEVANASIQGILSDFANQVIQNYPDIKCVTLGQGGKTPENLFEETLFPEKIRQGDNYGDADTQYCIARAPLALSDAQRETLQVIFAGFPESCVDYLASYVEPSDSNQFMATMQKLFIDSDNAHAFRESLHDFIDPDDMIPSANIIYAIAVLYYTHLLSDSSAEANLNTAAKNKDPTGVVTLLHLLQQTELLNNEMVEANRERIAKHDNIEQLTNVLVSMHKANLLKGNFAQSNFEIVANHRYLKEISEALLTLQTSYLFAEDTAQAYFEIVVKHQNPISAINALYRLHKASVLTGKSAQANRELLLKFQDPLKGADDILKLVNSGLLTDEDEDEQTHRKLIAEHHDPHSAALGLLALHEGGLLTRESAKANREVL